MAAIVPGGTGLVNATYSYDANGNMTSGNGRTTTWTSFNKVASITRGTATVSFDYNGEHTRIRQVTASQTTLYITDPATGVSLEKVTGSGGSIQWNLNVRVGDRLVAQRSSDHSVKLRTISWTSFNNVLSLILSKQPSRPEPLKFLQI